LTRGLHREAVLGLQLIASDERLRHAIRSELAAGERKPRQGRSSATASPHYAGQIAADLFEEQTRLTAQIEALRAADDEEAAYEQRSADVSEQFDEIASYLAEIDVSALWDAATDNERRVLIDELIEFVDVCDDDLDDCARRTQAEHRAGGGRPRTPG
jgi:hypothetical protein